jgi:predicted ATPase
MGGSPSEKPVWNLQFESSNEWQGSLEQWWVYQDTLDLQRFRDKGTQERYHLAPFVEMPEAVLGENRRIKVKGWEAKVRPLWAAQQDIDEWVSLDQLPSGEQQVLLLFGELARRKRMGAVIAIDEPEISLHPTLQRLVMWNLRKLAREWDAQVIVATHSLEVIKTARGGAYINLDYPEDHFDLPAPENGEEAGR